MSMYMQWAKVGEINDIFWTVRVVYTNERPRFCDFQALVYCTCTTLMETASAYATLTCIL